VKMRVLEFHVAVFPGIRDFLRFVHVQPR
jgi:hypothetical protein